MAKKKKTGATKKPATDASGSFGGTATPPPASASPTPGPSTPPLEKQAPMTTPIEPSFSQPATETDSIQTDGADQPEQLKARADTLKEQGNVFFKNKEYEKAIGLYTESVKIYPSEPAYYTNRAAASIAQQKFRDALQDCQRAQSMQADAPQTKTLLRLARCQIATGAPVPALSTLRVAQSLEKAGGQNPELWRLKSKAEEMHQHLETVSQARAQKQWAKASLALDAALKLCEGGKDDIPTEWRGWAVAFKIARREYDSALDAIREASRWQANSPELMALRGQVYFLMNRIPEATAPLQVALRLDPENGQARNMLKRVKEFEKVKAEGNKLFAAQKNEEAILKYNEALEVVGQREEEGGGGVVRAILLSNRATAKMRLGKDSYGEALQDVEESLQLHPDNWKAIRTRGKIRLSRDEYEAAIVDFRTAHDIVEREDGHEKFERELSEEIRKAEVLLKRSKEKDYYKILEIERTVTELDIKKAYRKQSLLHHPDKGGDEEKFKLASEAFQVLSDPEKRRRYDAGEDVDGQMSSDNPFGGMGGMGGFPPGMMEQMLFAQMFGGQGGGGGSFGAGGFGAGGFGGGGARFGGAGGSRRGHSSTGGHGHSHSQSPFDFF